MEPNGDLPPYLTYGLNLLLINLHIVQYLHLLNKYPKRVAWATKYFKKDLLFVLHRFFLDAVRARRKKRRSRERSGTRRGRGVRTGSGAQTVPTRSSRRRRGKSGSGRDTRMPRMTTGGNVWRTHTVAKLFFI
jgi:hypothetical protein